jgi:hypothetical protein
VIGVKIKLALKNNNDKDAIVSNIEKIENAIYYCDYGNPNFGDINIFS